MPTETVSSVGVYAILEGNSPQTTSGVITYFDYEFGVPSVSSKNILGVYGTFSYYIEHQLENRGTAYWSYTTEDSVESLVEGQTVTEIFSIRSYSGTVLSVVSIDVTGTGEVAVVSNPQSIAAYRSSIFYKTGKLQNVVDADLGENKYVPQFQTQGTYGLFSVDENGDWSYSANFESAFSQNGVLITETFTVSSHDGSASTTITIDIIDDTVIYEPYTLLTASKLGGVVIDSNDPVDGDYLIATSATSAEWTTL
jgi:VCBS repeat-containing protein